MPPNMPAPLYPWQPQPFWPFYYKWWPLTRWSTHGLSVHVMRFCSSVMLGHDGLLWGAISLSLSSSPLQLISTGSSSALLEPSKSSNQIPKIPNHQATTNNFLRKTAKDMTILWRRKGEKKTQGYFFPKEVLSTTQKHLKLHLNRTKHYSNAWTLSRVASSSTLPEIAFGIILWLLKTEQWKTKCFSKPLAPLFSIFSLIFLFLFPYVT